MTLTAKGDSDVEDSAGANGMDEDDIRLRYGIPRARVLSGVLPIAEVRNVKGSDISLISLENYEDGFRLLWRIWSERPKERSSMLTGGRHPSLLFGQATDDLGNTYTGGFPGGGGGSDVDWHGEALFTPALAGASTRLTLRIEEIQWMSWSPAVRSSAEIGPWIFDIPLANMQSVTRDRA
jgi:hypothetical protein